MTDPRERIRRQLEEEMKANGTYVSKASQQKAFATKVGRVLKPEPQQDELDAKAIAAALAGQRVSLRVLRTTGGLPRELRVCGGAEELEEVGIVADENLIEVRMGLLPETVREVELLQRLFGAENRTDAVARCIHIASHIATAMAQGKTVKIVHENGDTQTLTIPGLRKLPE